MAVEEEGAEQTLYPKIDLFKNNYKQSSAENDFFPLLIIRSIASNSI